MLLHTTGFPSFLRLNIFHFVYLLIDGHLGCFYVLTVVTSATGSSCSSSCSSITYSSLCFQFFQVHIQKPEIAGSYYKFVFSFLSQFFKINEDSMLGK